LEDLQIWIEQKVYVPDEIAARFHHHLVAIHLYANGNGQHARLMADLLLVHILDRPHFTWGSKSLVQAGSAGRVISARFGLQIDMIIDHC
jgi:fido (protein-threonine AMPylation protein)